MSISVSMTVNGKSVSGEVEARTLLVQFLREHLRLTGTHVGCDTSQCGACVISRMDSPSAAAQCDDDDCRWRYIASDARGFRENHGLQCGFCTPGMVMSALDLVKNNPDPSETEIREWLEGNIAAAPATIIS